MRVLFTLPLLILFALSSCRKSEQVNVFNASTMPPPLVVLTSLADTLPEKSFTNLHVKDVRGFKVKYATGQSVSYFEYQADRVVVLDTLAKLPFSKNSARADVQCRLVPYQSLEILRSAISGYEIETGSAFWEADSKEFDVYECIKAPFRHTVLLSKRSARVIHRIEYAG